MYCSLGQNQFFDDDGSPLSGGRIKIYAKGSDTLLPIYVDNGEEMVPAQNPVIAANDGRIPTIFWQAALVDVVVERSNGGGSYTEVDSFVAGLDLSSVDAIQGVGSITELRSIMPSENMVVQVNGYYTEGDSPTRKYLWVAGAANIDDGGYVVASYRDYNGGRWVMLWDDPEFLPVSLYGIMCGYVGYSKTSSIPALEALGHYVLVGSVRVEVPPVILFDSRMAQPTSGQLSPVAYHWNGTFTTTHYVACARGVTFSSTSTPPTIHCAGVRGESYAYAYWLVDQNYTSNDPFERISTLMFSGNTQAMHDAFMACVACDKVKFVELYEGGVHDTLTSSDSFLGKVVIDYAYYGSALPVYDPILYSIRMEPRMHRLSATSILSRSCYTSLLEASTMRFPGSQGLFLTKPSGSGNYPDSPLFPHGMYVEGAINASSEDDQGRVMHVIVNANSNVTLDLTSDSATEPVFYNSKYKIGDMIVVTNTGSARIDVNVFNNASYPLLLDQSCWFIKIESNKWSKVSA